MQFFRIFTDKIASQDEKSEPKILIVHFSRIFDPLRTKKIGGLTLGGGAAGSNAKAKRTCGVI